MQVFFQKNPVIRKTWFLFLWWQLKTLSHLKVEQGPHHWNPTAQEEATVCGCHSLCFVPSKQENRLPSHRLKTWQNNTMLLRFMFMVVNWIGNYTNFLLHITHFLPCCHLLYLQAFAVVLCKVHMHAKSFLFIHFLPYSLLKSSKLRLAWEL